MILLIENWGEDLKRNSQKKIDKWSLNILKSCSCTSN